MRRRYFIGTEEVSEVKFNYFLQKNDPLTYDDKDYDNGRTRMRFYYGLTDNVVCFYATFNHKGDN